MTTKEALNQKTPIITTWMGRNIEELSRAELIHVVATLGRELSISNENHTRTLRMWDL